MIEILPNCKEFLCFSTGLDSNYTPNVTDLKGKTIKIVIIQVDICCAVLCTTGSGSVHTKSQHSSHFLLSHNTLM